MRFGCRDCCEKELPPPPKECVLKHVVEQVRRGWSAGTMNNYRRVCNDNVSPLLYPFWYAPSKTRLSPPDGNPGHTAGGSCFGGTSMDYFVDNRPTSRFVGERGWRCNPFAVIPGLDGGTEEPASVWDCGTDFLPIYGMSSSTGNNANPGGHWRAGVRWPEWAWDRENDPPAMTLWEWLADCVGFEPSKITVKLNISWNFAVDLVIGGINNAAFLWGENEAKVAVTTTWEVAIKTEVFNTDEPAARAMLAGDLGGRTLWDLTVVQTIPGDAHRGGWAGTYFEGLQESGSQPGLEFDMSQELQRMRLDSNVLWIGPKISPPFGEQTEHLAMARPRPLLNPVPYPVGYWRKGSFSAEFLPVAAPPPGGQIIDQFFIYP